MCEFCLAAGSTENHWMHPPDVACFYTTDVIDAICTRTSNKTKVDENEDEDGEGCGGEDDDGT